MISTTPSSRSPRTASMACSFTRLCPFFQRSWRSRNAAALPANSCRWPIMWGWKWNARSRKPSRLGTTRMVFIPREPADPSVRRRLVQSKILNTFGLVASQSGGLRENFGTMTKPFQAGHAAESGVVSTELVVLGWTAAEQILEAERGFFHAFGGSYEPAAIMNRLGKPWTFASPGISLKPYPSGSLPHPAMTELARLIEANNIQAAQVEKVDVGANHNMTTTLLHHQPKTGLEAKFSMEFCLAILLLERKAGLGEFSDKVAQRADVREVIGRINFYVDPEAENAGFDKMTSILKIHLKDGKVITGRADFAKGSPANPMTFEEAATKFRGCAEYAGCPKGKAEKIIAFVKSLDTASDFSPLWPLLSAEKG